MPLLLPPASSPKPSPAILDFLAHLSPPLSPDSPPAPAFLCPSCQRPELSSARRRRRQLPTPSSSNPSVIPPEQQQPQPQLFPQHPHNLHRSKTSNQFDRRIASVPPKYVQSSDGFWYPATSWNLHGQTSQPNLLSTPTTTLSPPPPPSTLPLPPSDVVSATRSMFPTDADLDDDDDDDAADFTSSVGYTSSVESVVASDYDAIKDSLPTGWTTPAKRTQFYSIPVIVVVSLILAISLSLIIAACVLGHKARSGSRRQSVRKILNEAKSRANAQKSLSRRSSASDLVVDAENGDPELEMISDSERAEQISKNLKRKERLWDKWRSKSGKLSDIGLRRRKKKTAVLNNSTTGTTSALTQSVPDGPATPMHSARVSSIIPPPAISALPIDTTSTLSGQSGSPPSPLMPSVNPALNISSLSSQATSTSTTADDEHLLATPTRSTSRRLPPAYRYGAAVVVAGVQNEASSSYTGQSDAEFDEDPETHPEYSPLVLSSTAGLPLRAHVATDDKAVLEMMRKGASEPRQDDAHVLTSVGNTTPQQSESVHPNAPVWVDESLEHFESLEDTSDRDSCVKSSPSGSKLQLPPPPSPDLHRRLERHYNVDVLFPPAQSSTQANLVSQSPSLRGSEPPSPGSGLGLTSSPSLRPSAPPVEDEGDGSSLPGHLRPSAPPLLPDLERTAGEEDDLTLDNEESEHSDERQSRWDREADLEASLARTRSTPGTLAPVTISFARPQRRRSLSISSFTNDSSDADKRFSLPRYEP